MAAGWTLDETKALVGIWGAQDVQMQLDGVARNRPIYEKIASAMAELGFERMWQQCKTKVKNLTQRYRKVKDENRVSGKGRSTCPIFEEIDMILGNRAASSPPIVIDSSERSEPINSNPSPTHVDESDETLCEDASMMEESILNNSGSDEELVQQRGESSTGSQRRCETITARKRGQKQKREEGLIDLVTLFQEAEERAAEREERAAEREARLRERELEMEAERRKREDQREDRMLYIVDNLVQRMSYMTPPMPPNPPYYQQSFPPFPNPPPPTNNSDSDQA